MEYKAKEYIVAFIDILGASKKIKADSEKSLNVVHEVYNSALRSCDQLYDNENISKLKPVVKIYSDNIVIAVPTDVINAFSAFLSVAILSGLIQHEFLQRRYLVRGGIAMGDFFADDIMIWGNALLDAYYIENNISIYPRIVVHPETVANLQIATKPNSQKWLKQDSDGLFFVDYMQETGFKAHFFELLLFRIQECEQLFLEVVGDVKSEQKIHWHNSYLQSKLDIYSPEYSDELVREIEKLEAKTKQLEGIKV